MTATAPLTHDPRPIGSAPAEHAASVAGDAARQPIVQRFADDEDGATAIEYALMAMFFSVTVIGGSSSIRNALQTAFTTVSSAILSATNS